MDIAGVRAAFDTAGLSRVVKDLDRIARPSIRVVTTAADESTLRVGASKLGGLPDLPPEVPWPTRRDLPQSFIAQIRLAQVYPYDVQHALPQSGILWFFYDAQ